jgi:hypothetical protein
MGVGGMIRQTKGEPDGRLTEMTAAALDAIEAHPAHLDGDRVILILDDGRHGGVGLGGYENEREVLGELLAYAVALGRARGRRVAVRVTGRMRR